jgi:hypothetical protein
VAHIEREVRNLGRPLCLPGGHTAGVGKPTIRRLSRWVQRGDSDRLTVGRGKCLVSSKVPEPCRKGRRDNVARKGNMDR